MQLSSRRVTADPKFPKTALHWDFPTAFEGCFLAQKASRCDKNVTTEKEKEKKREEIEIELDLLPLTPSGRIARTFFAFCRKQKGICRKQKHICRKQKGIYRWKEAHLQETKADMSEKKAARLPIALYRLYTNNRGFFLSPLDKALYLWYNNSCYITIVILKEEQQCRQRRG